MCRSFNVNVTSLVKFQQTGGESEAALTSSSSLIFSLCFQEMSYVMFQHERRKETGPESLPAPPVEPTSPKTTTDRGGAAGMIPTRCLSPRATRGCGQLPDTNNSVTLSRRLLHEVLQHQVTWTTSSSCLTVITQPLPIIPTVLKGRSCDLPHIMVSCSSLSLGCRDVSQHPSAPAGEALTESLSEKCDI